MRTKRLTSLSARLDALEAAAGNEQDDQIFVTFVDGNTVISNSKVELTIPDNLRGMVWHNGEAMTREEAERRFHLDSKPHRTITITGAKED